MKKRAVNIIFLFALLFIFRGPLLGQFIQNMANNWQFGYSSGLDFNSGIPVPVPGGNINSLEGNATISDPVTGQLLFYSDGETVWDKNHNQMPNGWGLGGGPSSTQSAFIVPMQGNADQYYLFTVDDFIGVGGLAYSIVDMTLNGGSGDIVTGSKNILLSSNMTEKLTGIRHCNGTDTWIVAHTASSNTHYSYLVSAAGVGSPVISSVGPSHSEFIGYHKSTPDGTKLASVWYSTLGGAHPVELFDFDNTTGAVSNYVSLGTVTDGYGLELSPDGTKLYVAAWNLWGGSNLYQYDLTATNILSTQTVIGTSQNALGAIQMGPDGKLYVTRVTSNYLGVVNSPDLLGTACNYVDNGVSLGSSTSSGGLPDFLDDMSAGSLQANFTSTTVCTGTPTQFTDSSFTNPVTWLWNFGDTASVPFDTSTAQNPAHSFSGTGTYSVTLIVSDGVCASDTIIKTVTVNPLPTADFMVSPSILLINQDVLFDDNSLGASTYFWDFGDGTTSNLSDPVHIYSDTGNKTVTLIVTNAFGCTDTIQLVIHVQDKVGIYLPNAFTPNGDGINDTYVVFGTGISSIDLKIFNRWGELIYEDNDVKKSMTFGWDGKRNGVFQNAGVYTYYATGGLSDGKPFEKKGNITLLR